ncbi:precorrin-6A reductase [Streptococcus sp. 10F2]
MKILLLGGTSDSLRVLDYLGERGHSVTTSVVTDYGRILAEKHGQPVIQGRLTATQMVEYMREQSVELLLDVTHPFADLVSKEAMKAAKQAKLPYLRFERPATEDLSGSILVRSYQEAIDWIKEQGHQVVYLGTGSKTLGLFVEGVPSCRFIARVLPTSQVLAHCESLGLVADQIDALKSPLSIELQRALLERSQATVFVTKESGQVGGIREKIDLCAELGMECLIIGRPELSYPRMVSTLEELEVYLEERS